MPRRHLPESSNAFTDHGDQGRITAINLQDDEGTRLWCLALNVDKATLVHAVSEVGCSAEVVQRFLAQHAHEE